MNCAMQERYATRFWQDYVADTLGGIAYGMIPKDKRGGVQFTLYSDIAHPQARRGRRTDSMSAKEIKDYVLKRLGGD